MQRDGRLRWATGIVAVLLVAALAAGWTRYRDLHALRAAAQASTRAHWLHQPPKNAHTAAHYGVYAFKPVQPLSFVDRGVDPYVGVFAWLEAHKQNDFKYRPAQDGTAIERFGTWTAASVLQLLVPLIIVMAVFPAFSAERELGTLSQLLASGVRPRDLLLGKSLGVAGALGVLLVPTALAGAIALTMGSEVASLRDTWIRILMMALAYLLYFAIFVAAALAISAWASTARTALVTLLAFWCLNALIIPRGIADLARRVHPVASALHFNLAMEHDLAAGGGEGLNRALEDSLLAVYRVRSTDELPFNFRGLSLARGEEHGNRVFDATYARMDSAFGQQDRVEYWLSAVSPLVAVRALSMGLAGTDYPQHRDFAQQAEYYRRSLVNRMNAAVLRYDPKGSGSALQSDSALWASVPAFNYDAPSAGRVLARYAWAFGVLIVWSLVAAAFAAFCAARASTLTQNGSAA